MTLRLALIIVIYLDLFSIWLRVAVGPPRPTPGHHSPSRPPHPTAVVGRQLSSIQAQQRCFCPY